MSFLLVELGCIECGNAKSTEITGSFPTFEDGLAAMQTQLDKDGEWRKSKGWYPLQIERRPAENGDSEYDRWSPSLVAHAGEAGWRLQLHKVSSDD